MNQFVVSVCIGCCIFEFLCVASMYVLTLISQGSASEVMTWLQSQNVPVVILHQQQDKDDTPIRITRRLYDDDDKVSTVIPLTEFQISEYQVCD